MTFVHLGAIGECGGRTQVVPMCRHMGMTEDPAARRRGRLGQ